MGSLVRVGPAAAIESLGGFVNSYSLWRITRSSDEASAREISLSPGPESMYSRTVWAQRAPGSLIERFCAGYAVRAIARALLLRGTIYAAAVAYSVLYPGGWVSLRVRGFDDFGGVGDFSDGFGWFLIEGDLAMRGI